MTEQPVDTARVLIETYNAGDWDALRELIRPDYIHHSGDQDLTREQFLRGAAWVRTVFPDFRLRLVELAVDGERVVMSLTGEGTHEGSMFGEPPTSATISFPVGWTIRLDGGLLAEDWETLDEAALERQLRGGASPA